MMPRYIYLYIDDIRIPPEKLKDVILARSYSEAVETLTSPLEPSLIIVDLDHDLGEDSKSGYDICKYIVENQIPIAGFHIHSMNPVGVANMRQLMIHYGYKEFI